MKKRVFVRIIIILLIFLNMRVLDTYAFWYDEEIITEKKKDTSTWPKSKREEHEREWQNREKTYIRKWIKSDFYDYAKSGFYVIDEDNDNIGFNYCFDERGALFTDTITPDYRVVDKEGREVDSELRPIEYKILQNGKIVRVGDREDNYIEETKEEETTTIEVSKEPAKVLIGKGVVLRKKEKVYDNSIDKNMFSYIDSSYKYSNDKKGEIFSEVVWNRCGILRGNGSYVVFKNELLNFNKVSGLIATEYFTESDRSTICTLTVYDASEYFSNKEDINPIYETSDFNYNGGYKFSFTFDRDIEKLLFLLEVSGEWSARKCYIKDMKYGFNKRAYEEFLIEKLDEEEEIERLKRLGIYYEDLDYLDEYIDEDGEIIDEEDSEYDELDGRRYEDSDIFEEETEEYSSEDRLRDKYTGPHFDKDLKDVVDKRDIGPKVE